MIESSLTDHAHDILRHANAAAGRLPASPASAILLISLCRVHGTYAYHLLVSSGVEPARLAVCLEEIVNSSVPSAAPQTCAVTHGELASMKTSAAAIAASRRATHVDSEHLLLAALAVECDINSIACAQLGVPLVELSRFINQAIVRGATPGVPQGVDSLDETKTRINQAFDRMKSAIESARPVNEVMAEVVLGLTQCLCAYGAIAWDIGGIEPKVIATSGGVRADTFSKYVGAAMSKGRHSTRRSAEGFLLLFQAVSSRMPMLLLVIQRPVQDRSTIAGFVSFVERVGTACETAWGAERGQTGKGDKSN